MSSRSTIRTFVAIAALAQAMTSAVSAQSVSAEPGPRSDIERAMRLEAEAWALISQRGKLDNASRKLREAARLRPEDDHHALSLLRTAGRLAYAGNDFRTSRALLLEQAERALRIGEVGMAAHALLDAAFAAKELNDVAAFDYVARARLLATSTLLAASERAIINKRTGREPTIAAQSGAAGR